MGIFARLFKNLESGRMAPILPEPDRRSVWIYSGGEGYFADADPDVDKDQAMEHPYDLDVVGESKYQDNIKRIVGRPDPEGVKVVANARLVCEDDNPHDSNAVRVDVAGLQVGYLDRYNAKRYRKGQYPDRCHGLVRGGFQKKDGSWAHYGVMLNLKW